MSFKDIVAGLLAFKSRGVKRTLVSLLVMVVPFLPPDAQALVQALLPFLGGAAVLNAVTTKLGITQ